MKKNFVSLVGAGAGTIDLLTLKAVECLKNADVVIFDRLADEKILQFVPKSAELIYVGKSSSQHTLTQDQINQLLVDKSKNRYVVRLKGGDPLVFGRGGEEAIFLREHGIEFEIVPGISSSIAVPAYAGIPVTHRGIAKNFAVITGHEMNDESTIKFENFVGIDTLIFLMSAANIEVISRRLIDAGKNPKTPAAIIRWGTRENQQTIITTLDQAKKITPPAIFIVGEVVNLRDKIEWFESRALFGKKIIVTRTRKQASKLSTALENLGAAVFEIPTIEIVPPDDSYSKLDQKISELTKFDWIIFTSSNGVDAFFDRLKQSGKDSRALGGIKIAVIGKSTAETLEKFSLTADLIPEKFVAESLLESFEKIPVAGKNFLIPRAETARDVLPDGLQKLGANVEAVPAYRTKIPESTAKIPTADLVTFTSSSTVKNFVEMFGIETLSKIPSASIGPITSDTIRSFNVEPVVTAEEFTISGLVNAIEKYFRGKP